MVGNKCKSSNNYANNTNSCKYKKAMKQLHILYLDRMVQMFSTYVSNNFLFEEGW